MLTAKENMRETILGRNPDRFVNQYEALALLPHPTGKRSKSTGRPLSSSINVTMVSFSSICLSFLHQSWSRWLSMYP